MIRLSTALFFVCSAILLSACSSIVPQPTEDISYLTPIPEATRNAFKYDGPVTTRLEAAMVALAILWGAILDLPAFQRLFQLKK